MKKIYSYSQIHIDFYFDIQINFVYLLVSISERGNKI
jgi:hypothetical protein